MQRAKIEVCMKDREYQARFVKCWMNHYQEYYELHIFTELNEMRYVEVETEKIILIEGYSEKEIEDVVKENNMILILGEDCVNTEEKEHLLYTEKYQEVYKIEQKIRDILRRENIGNRISRNLKEKYRLVGIFSLDCEKYQLPFAALTALEHGEKEHTILVNLQAFSEVDSVEEANGISPLGMEDVLTIAETERYNDSRILGAIGHEQNWDYLFPVKNTECLAEANGERYQNVLHILANNLGYKVLILNFGVIFEGFFELMEQCEEFYLLTDKREEISWREQMFHDELRRRGKETFLQQITKVEMPKHFCGMSMNWRSLVQQWRWSMVGDCLREAMREG